MAPNVPKIHKIISIIVFATKHLIQLILVSEMKMIQTKSLLLKWKIILKDTLKILTKKIVTFYSDLPELSESKVLTLTKKLPISQLLAKLKNFSQLGKKGRRRCRINVTRS